MKNVKTILIFIFLLGFSATIFAQVPVQLPTLSVSKGDTIAVPITVGDFQNNDIYSCYTIIKFRQQVLTPLSATNVGTVSENWAAPVANLDSLGIFKLGLYGAERLPGAGTLVFLNFIVTGDFSDTTSLVFEKFEFNANHAEDPQPTLQNGFVSIKQKPITVTVTSSVGDGTTVIVDGETYPAPYTTTWIPGSEHTLGIESPQQAGADTMYYFEAWNDEMAQEHLVAPTTDTVFTATLRTQYLVKLVSEHGSPKGAGWYDAGSQATISVDTLIAGEANTRFRFDSWTGTGAGAYSGADNPAVFTVDGPVTEQVNWITQYKLDVNTLPLDLVEISGTGWYDEGAEATTGTAPDSVGEGEDKRDFFYWMVDGKKVEGNPATVIMDTSHVASAAYLGYISVQVGTNLAENSKVIIDGDTLEAPVTMTWNQGTEHTLDVPETQLEQNGVRFTFESWCDTGAKEHIVAPVGDTTFTATFLKEFQINVITEPAELGDLTATSWHPDGATVEMGPAPDTLTYEGKLYAFAYWKIDEIRDFQNSASVIVDTSKTLCAHFFQNAFIQGTVVVMNESVAGVKVYLNSTKVDSCTTTENGDFIFENLTAGDYALLPEFPGIEFEESQLAIDLNNGNVKNFVLTAVDTLAPEITLENPLGGENLFWGDVVDLRWKANDNIRVDSLELFFSADSGQSWAALGDVSVADTTLQWTVPEVVATNCFIQMQARDNSGNLTVIQNATPFSIENATGVTELPDKVFSFQLHQNYPNPFNPATEITFEMPKAGNVTVKIFNITGQEIATLFQGWATAGPHRVKWMANDLSSGIYFYQFQGLGKVLTRRMLLTK